MDEMKKALQDMIQKSTEEMKAQFDVLSTGLKKVSGEISTLHKQVEDFGGDLDTVKRQQAETTRAPPQNPRAPPQANKTACLANNGPPLLNGPGRPNQAAGDRDRESDTTTAESGEFRAKPPKHNFPSFNGDHPLLWIDLCYVYFEMFHVPSHHWVNTATLYFEGHAALWLQAHKRQHRLLRWDSFIAAVVLTSSTGRWPSLFNSSKPARFLSTSRHLRRACTTFSRWIRL